MSLFFKRAYLFFFILIFFHILTSQSNAFQPTIGSWTFVGLNNYIIHSFTVDPNNPNILYAGTAGYGIFKSTDRGTTWNTINNGITNYSGYFTDIIVDPTHSNIIYAGGVGVDDGSTGILKSTDGGATWTYSHNGIINVGFGGPPKDVSSMIIDPTNHNTLYAAIGSRCGSVYKSSNAAGTWTRGIGLACDPTVVRIDPLNPNILYTRTSWGQGINKSTDGGANWTNISSFFNNNVLYSLAIDPSNSSNLYANGNDGLYKSTDGGFNWILSSGALNNIYKALVTDPVRTNTVYAGEDLGIETSAYMTINDGSTWTDITNGLPNVGVKRLLVPINDSNILYAATEVGIYAYGLASDNQLSVPYFSQNSLPWGPTEYDNSSGKLSNPTMDRWGCAVTSAAMVLRFHNINQFTDGTPIDPGSLNNWLKNNKGYLTGYNNLDGFYSYFNWPIIGKLTKQLFDAHKANVKLTHKRAYPNNNTTVILNEDLSKFPDILGVNNSQTSSHFVVAKGKSNNTYSINDPEWNYPTLASFNDNYTQVDRYIPSQTNLSYLVAVVNPSVELLITDPLNNKTGKYFNNGVLQELNAINKASYSFQPPINNQQENLGTGVNEFLLPEPTDGEYKIKLSSDQNTIYEMSVSTLQEDGNDNLNTIKGIISKNSDETLIINYSQTENSNTSKVVTFESFMKDLDEAIKLNQIKNDGIYNSLLAKATIAQLSSPISKKTSINILNAMLNEIKAQKGKGITEDVYQILIYDINYLKNHL
ncbi:MAG: C39 family peptidase [Patescibacteria group bacterium]